MDRAPDFGVLDFSVAERQRAVDAPRACRLIRRTKPTAKAVSGFLPACCYARIAEMRRNRRLNPAAATILPTQPCRLDL
jgi:hypothetical protein